MKKICLFGIIIIVMFSLVSANAQERKSFQNLYTSFKSINSIKDVYNINGKAQLNNTFMNTKEMKNICLQISRKLNLKAEYNDICYYNNKDFNQVYLYNKKECISIIVESQESDNINTTYIIIDINRNQVYNNIVEDFYDVKSVLNLYDKNPEIYSCLVGYFNGKIDCENKKNIIKNTFKNLNAKEFERIENSTIVSVTGYSSNIYDYIEYNGHKANINMSLRYNVDKDRTYIYLATPLIVLEY